MKQIPLTRGLVAIVDDEDYDMLMQWKWTYLNKGYAYRHIYDGHRYLRTALMHRQIMGLLDTPSVKVDHINHDGLDNRRSNLRRATQQQNQWNCRKRSGKFPYKGIRKRPKRNWQALIELDGRCVTIGSFPTAEDAARAYDDCARRHFGEFACLNFPEIP